MNFKNIVNNIDSLPPLSNAANIVRSLYASGVDDISISRLTKVIESDAMLAGFILKMINSPYYNLEHKVSSVYRAITLFGSKNTYMLVVRYSISQTIKADPSIYGFTNVQFNDVCQLQQTLMLRWYSTINKREAEFLAPLALIMESGKLILSKEVINSDYCGEFRKGFNECENIQDYEKSLIDVTSYFLTAILFEHWNLEPRYVKILKNLDYEEEEVSADTKDEDNKPKRRRSRAKTYEKELNVIRTAISVKDILTDSSIKEASEIVQEMGFDAQEFKEIAVDIRKSYFK